MSAINPEKYILVHPATRERYGDKLLKGQYDLPVRESRFMPTGYAYEVNEGELLTLERFKDLT